MDAKKLGVRVIKEAIEKGNYELSGILETGEIVVSIISDTEIDILKNINTEEQLKKLIDIKGRPAKELVQVYNQKNSNSFNRCYKNNLRIR